MPPPPQAVHTPSEHVPPAPPQLDRQLPQLSGSVDTSVHVPLHARWPAGHWQLPM
jgi:hypothetical protein